MKATKQLRRLKVSNETLHKDFAAFEFNLRVISESILPVDRDLLNTIKQAIIVFSMAEKFNEENVIFLQNNKIDFDKSCKRLSEKYPNLSDKIKIIVNFMKKYYFKGETTNE